MKKTLMVISISVGVLALGVGIFYSNNYLNQPSEEEIQEAQEQIEETFKMAEDDMPEEEQVSLKEFFPDDMSEDRMQTVLHSMSHQKVRAEEKWGQLQITQERVERLLEVAKLNENNEEYKHGKSYVAILERWATGDFSKSVHAHNFIWELQGGTVGEAIGLMSPVEEKAYIEKYFKNEAPIETDKNNEKNN